MICENIDLLIEETEYFEDEDFAINEGLTIGQKATVGALFVPIPILAGYLLYRYFTSINFIKKRIASVETELKNTTDPIKKEKLANKLVELEAKLEKSKARARDERRKFIAKMKFIKQQIDELNKKDSLTDTEKAKLESLKKKLNKGQALLQKIGAEI